jgi:uncharacterized protein (TIGR00369 family)
MILRHTPGCFGCSHDNAQSLGIVNTTIDDGVESRVRFGREHEGAPGLVHGGLLALLLDEAMGSIPVDVHRVRLTAEMNVRYRRPTHVDIDLICRARAGETSGDRFVVDATIVDAVVPDVVLVEGRATYVLLKRDR